ncbi:kinase-like domain [Pyrenophora seminiperda CCB06]|uniref:Kinase-like domain n=1 Tax=Pyrenophora seminiperda CCB06 TaxID=1302712 RepID=A0A3M7MF22_9PLEO|nr:kinase-like domain [Pyrenophora seminiperda CCB06]
MTCYEVEEFSQQGYCSYTLLVTPSSASASHRGGEHEHAHTEKIFRGKKVGLLIVQLRPTQHMLDIRIACEARKIYASLAPVTHSLQLSMPPLPARLWAFEMEKLAGMPLTRLLPRERRIDAQTKAKLKKLVVSFADFVARAWQSRVPSCDRTRDPMTDRMTRADSPMDDMSDTSFAARCTGKVGSSILHRLSMLAAGLPDPWLRERAEKCLCAVQRMPANYPVVLNHGDLIPSNILADEQTWKINGVVDWAEAEYLPFGMCLYGLEHLLGFYDASLDGEAAWVWFHGGEEMRGVFWRRLVEGVPELRGRLGEVRVMRDVGVLLWHGIAWDGGAIDRVVNEVDDVEELVKLRAFLDVA